MASQSAFSQLAILLAGVAACMMPSPSWSNEGGGETPPGAFGVRPPAKPKTPGAATRTRTVRETPAEVRQAPRLRPARTLRSGRPALTRRSSPTETAPSGLPPQGETRFLADQVIVRYRLSSSQRTRDALVRRIDLRHLDGRTFSLAGVTAHRYEIVSGAAVATVIAALERDPSVVTAQPNYLYEAQQEAKPAAPEQYAIGRLGIPEAHGRAEGDGVAVAIIDSAVDVRHPEFAGKDIRTFDARDIPGGAADSHGTAVAGIMAAGVSLTGISPKARIVGIAALARDSSGRVLGNSWTVAKALDIARAENARILNLSFAGPEDPLVERSLTGGARRGMVAIAASGNAGPTAPPLYPAAYVSTIAVTATDVSDAIFADASGGAHVAIAAPGVDILTLAPGGAFSFASGTSLATAYVSGIAALLLSADPAMDRAALDRVLAESATDLGTPGRDAVFGAGLPNAASALKSLATQ